MATIEMNDSAGQAAALAQARSLGYGGSENMNSVASWFVDNGYQVHFAGTYIGGAPAAPAAPAPATNTGYAAPTDTGINLIGNAIIKVVLNEDGSEYNTIVQYQIGNAFPEAHFSSLNSASKAMVKAWMVDNPAKVIDQRYDWLSPTEPEYQGSVVTKVDTTPVAQIPTDCKNIDPPEGNFEQTRQYLKQFANWQAVTIRGGLYVAYVYDGGIVDSDGKFLTGYGGYSAPSGSRPGGAYKGVATNTNGTSFLPTSTSVDSELDSCYGEGTLDPTPQPEMNYIPQPITTPETAVKVEPKPTLTVLPHKDEPWWWLIILAVIFTVLLLPTKKVSS